MEWQTASSFGGRRSAVAQHANQGLHRQRSVPEKQHRPIPDTAFVFVWKIALLLLNEIQDYFGRDYIAKNDVHRLKNMTNFRKHGMLIRMYQQMVGLSGHYSMHYSMNEWANAFVVQRVIQTELDHVCDTRTLSCPHVRSCQFDAETRVEIVDTAMRSGPF